MRKLGKNYLSKKKKKWIIFYLLIIIIINNIFIEGIFVILDPHFQINRLNNFITIYIFLNLLE